MLTCAAYAQSTRQNPEPKLAISLEPDAPYTKLPRSFGVSLTNRTTHILRLPRPTLNCAAVPRGSLFLYLQFKPSQTSEQPMPGRGCVLDFAHSLNPILEQIASWETLLPGQSLTSRMLLEDVGRPPQPGTYTVFAAYKPAFVLPAERAELTLRGIDVPDADLSSAKLAYTVRVGRHAQ